MAQWRLLTWLQGLDLHRIVASALEKDSDAASHVFLCGLRSRGELTQLLQSKVVFESLVNVLWTHVGELQQAGTADGSDDRIASKFSGAVELSYSGLDTFFNGLEGVVGAPSPNVYDSMATEHVNGPDSVKQFVTGNYGIQTTSQIEWLYVVGEGVSCDQLGLTCWPKESEEKLAIHHHRTRRPLANIQRAAETRNEQLRRAGHLLLITEELISANMYTGPLFVKYNAVLRGLQTDVPFLLSTMVSLCCPEAVARGYAVGSVTIDEAKSSLNTYTTTLHAINSAVIKLGKLTKATKVYRGIAGMALPAEFWTPNEVRTLGHPYMLPLPRTLYANCRWASGVVLRTPLCQRRWSVMWHWVTPREMAFAWASCLRRNRAWCRGEQTSRGCLSTPMSARSYSARSRASRSFQFAWRAPWSSSNVHSVFAW